MLKQILNYEKRGESPVLMKMPAVSEMKIKMKLLLLVLFPLFAVSVIIGVCSGIMSAANLEKENSDRLQVALEGFSGDVNGLPWFGDCVFCCRQDGKADKHCCRNCRSCG